MKLNKTILALSILAGAATACTDEWDNHYEVVTPGEGTIWQVISSDESLSNFKAVLDTTGYKAALDGSQVFTVFAPTNSELTDEMRDQLIEQYKLEKKAGVKEKKNSVIKEFVQNHISLYNYSVAPSMSNTTINMMNGKHIAFTKSSFAGNGYLTQNVQTGNGVLFTIGKVAAYEPSVYERLSKDADLDSVWNYLSNYTIERFHSESSVPGEIIDGKTHYLDSVTVTENHILKDWLEALIDNEDSTYWMLAPTNEVWKSELERNETYFQYDEKIAERDSFMYHYPRINILYGTIFSRSQNAKIFANPDTAGASDSLMSTNAVPYIMRKYMYGSDDKKYYQYDNPFGENGILTGTNNFECSNGRIMKAADWKISPLSSFVREIVMEGESTYTIDSLNLKSDANRTGDTAPVKYVNVSSDNPFYNKVSNNRYLEISPLGANNFSKALFDIRGVLSNVPYDVYIVTVPAEAGDTAATEIQRLPVLFRCSLQCHNEKGNAYYINSKGEMKYPVYKNDDIMQGVTTNNTQSAILVNNLTNTPGVVDSVFVGTYTFPTCSFETSEAQVKMLIDTRVSNSVFGKTYNRTLRLDCIVFKPHVD